jgi:hypothetical protein
LNAHYFLGLAYQKIGRNADALAQFKLLAKVLPNNPDVKDAINSLSNISTPVTPAVTTTTTDTKGTIKAKSTKPAATPVTTPAQ